MQLNGIAPHPTTPNVISWSTVASESHALRAALLVLLTLRHDRRTEPAAKVFGEFVELGVAINLDGLLGRVADNVAVVAPGKVILQFALCLFVENAVQIAGQLV